MTPATDNPLRKAAVFVRSLAPEAAAAMLGRLSANEAGALRAAIAELTDVPDEERTAVATLVRQSRRQSSEDGAVELRWSGEVDALGSRSSFQATPSHGPEPEGAEWLRSLRDADPRAIAEYLSREQPRAVATILSHLPAELGAGVVQCLGPADRRRVLSQLAVQGEADPDSLRVIASGLADWIRRQEDERQRHTTRLATIRQIVAATPESARRELLADLADAEPEIARSLTALLPSVPPAARPTVTTVSPAQRRDPTPPLEFSFEELHRVDGRVLATAISKLSPRTALLALAGASAELIRQLTSGLPKGVARDLTQRIHRVGPTTLAEIDGAQLALASAVSEVVRDRRSFTANGRG